MKKFLVISMLLALWTGLAQDSDYWQQHADYKMEVVVDAKKYQYKGRQTLVYTNNSNDTLRKVFYHLFNNAFQPGSEMDARASSIADPDRRMVTRTKVGDKEVRESRISKLKPDEIGYLKISNFKQDGASAATKVSGTILEVTLAQPILPKSKSTFTLDFDGQVPVQIRRSGRNNSEGVEFSMSQWYPKLAEFDFEGWHTDAYIAREFHGVWGNFDVRITIDKDYVLGGSGYLQNKNEIGHGYQDSGVKVDHGKKKTLTWHFIAPNVHDFTWAADRNYLHDVVKGPNNVDLHFLYKNNPQIIDNWKALQPIMVRVMDYFNHSVGAYPYQQYSFIQGGDGGMEYAMCTLMLGNGKLEGMTETATHELAHAWFQHVLASNESKHPWMDEGFATYIEQLALNQIMTPKQDNPFAEVYATYYNLVKSGKEEPQSTHGDRYNENRPYSIASYYKGCLFLTQLGYLIGQPQLDQTIKRFYADFKFRHPTPNDIMRTAERVSGAQLGWYLNEWTQTTHTVDYAVTDVTESGKNTTVSLARKGRIPMPIDIVVEYTDGSKEYFYIPLRMMHYEKPNPYPGLKRTVLSDWAWGAPAYSFSIAKPRATIKSVVIDPSKMMTDVADHDNSFPPAEQKK